MGQTLRIVFQRSGRAGQELVLDSPVVTLGRDTASDVLFDERVDRVVSRRHAEIRWENGRPVAHPMPGKIIARAGVESTGPVPLSPGDELELAGVGGPSIVVFFEPAAPETELPTPPSGLPATPATDSSTEWATAEAFEAPTAMSARVVVPTPAHDPAVPSFAEPAPAVPSFAEPAPAVPQFAPEAPGAVPKTAFLRVGVPEEPEAAPAVPQFAPEAPGAAPKTAFLRVGVPEEPEASPAVPQFAPEAPGAAPKTAFLRVGVPEEPEAAPAVPQFAPEAPGAAPKTAFLRVTPEPEPAPGEEEAPTPKETPIVAAPPPATPEPAPGEEEIPTPRETPVVAAPAPEPEPAGPATAPELAVPVPAPATSPELEVPVGATTAPELAVPTAAPAPAEDAGARTAPDLAASPAPEPPPVAPAPPPVAPAPPAAKEPEAPRFSVRVVAGSLEGKVFPVGPGGLVAGRIASCQIRFNPQADAGVASRHCLIHVQKDKVLCDDLGTLGGLVVDGERQTRVELRPGVRVRLGPEGPVLELAGPPGEEPAPAPAPPPAPAVEVEASTQQEIPAIAAAPAPPAPAPAESPAQSPPRPRRTLGTAVMPPRQEVTTQGPANGVQAPPRPVPPSPAPEPPPEPAEERAPRPLDMQLTPQAVVASPSLEPRLPAPEPATPAPPPRPPVRPPPPRAPGKPPPEHHATMMLEALPAQPPPSGTGGQQHTQFLMVPIEAPAPERSRWKMWVAIGLSVAVALGGLGAAFARYQKVEKHRRLIARVERYKQALALQKPAEALSVEEWELYGAIRRAEGKQIDEELQKEVPRQVLEKMAPAAPSPEELAKKAAEEQERAAREAEKAAALEKAARERARLVPDVRAAFALLRRTELERLQLARSAKGGGKPRARFVMLGEKRQDLLAQYDAEVAKLQLDPAAPKPEQLARRAARNLGECGATMPATFLSAARAALDKRRTDKALRDELVAGLKRARDEHYDATVTAALADQGLPVELFFLALDLTGADPKAVGTDTGTGVPKGMFLLLPDPAQKFGAPPGPLATQPVHDPDDQRARYEVESRAAAKALRSVFFGPAGGSALLAAATFNGGDPSVLNMARQRAGVRGDDPAAVSFWRLWEAGALSESARAAALSFFALVTVALEPSAFGFAFAPPLQHVALAEGSD